MNTNNGTNKDDPCATAPMASGNQKITDFSADSAKAKADTARDRDSRSLVRNLPLGPMKPANAK
ncbi:hypothetical protein [Paraburkholderia caffeinilytica]|uniref:hypothetical protein n=1 Tax=Paraburkholderia caffeinilytica TaxID=1761016 RepID=UPI0038BAF34A